MKVWVVEEDCIDPYFPPSLKAIFSTEEKARMYVEAEKYKDSLSVNEWEVDAVENTIIDITHKEWQHEPTKWLEANTEQAEGRFERKP